MRRCIRCRHDYAAHGPFCHLCAYWRAYFGEGV